VVEVPEDRRKLFELGLLLSCANPAGDKPNKPVFLVRGSGIVGIAIVGRGATW
jgi:hypothetical protein